MVITVITPIRIDLAGGTLDLYPLRQFVYPEVFSTLNLAIDITNQVTLQAHLSDSIVVSSDDLEARFEYANLDELLTEIKKGQHPLMLILKSLYFFRTKGITLTTRSDAPKGSGLGNSSSLIVAVLVALNIYTKTGYNNNELLDIAQGIETSTLKIPTGSQDYIAALYGGLSHITYDLTTSNHYDLREYPPTDEFLNTLEKSSFLCYTEVPTRYTTSKKNPNWDIFKKSVEDDGATLETMLSIANNTHEMVKAITDNNWPLFIETLLQETALRSELSEMIMSAKMKELIDLLQSPVFHSKVEGYKICGAGGGGSVLIIASPGKRGELIKDFRERGYQVLDFAVNLEGLNINP